MYLPKSPKIFSKVAELDDVESCLDIRRLVGGGVSAAVKECMNTEGVKVRPRRANQNVAEQHETIPEPASAGVGS